MLGTYQRVPKEGMSIKWTMGLVALGSNAHQKHHLHEECMVFHVFVGLLHTLKAYGERQSQLFASLTTHYNHYLLYTYIYIIILWFSHATCLIHFWCWVGSEYCREYARIVQLVAFSAAFSKATLR